MQLTQIFQKPVDRPIEGVIKADDESSLLLEVEEYVLTNEVAKRLESFLEAYNDYRGSNGAWISGFFGSGKSHLLKILAMVLENRSINGRSALELFLTKCDDNAILRGSLQKAVSIPSRSILFNIDQKADVISKSQVDALLAVFVKVFDEMCGYYGKHGYIASFERDLARRGLLDRFIEEFRNIAGSEWTAGREQVLLEGENISQAYARITGVSTDSVSNILEKYRSDYHMSIEDFAVLVNEYIESQPPNFRLNFFVDEVGQYIANNIKLMTNLQTIAETLATRCRGRAWIVVTSQQEIRDITGEMNARQANDFSKIMDRFKTRMGLTSQNVAEVIQKRLLRKNATGNACLEAIYQQQYNNFGTLFTFVDGSRQYRNFHDQPHFVNSYPFIPYQFELFQSAIQALSLHDAFEGKHSSVGERSMLAVFQEVAKRIAGSEVGALASFDLMYEGIRIALRSQTQSNILAAERNLNHPFAVRVLKALFLVKYVKEFKASLHNISILMIDHFGQDQTLLRQQVQEALDLLEQQTYIQRNGELYEFLTNDEKDIEQEIKNVEVGADAVTAELTKLIFDQIIKEKKIRYDENHQDFAFSRKLDGQLQGRDSEVSINVITPFHEHFEHEETLRIRSMGQAELLVILPAVKRLMDDLLLYKRTVKYILQNFSTTQQDSVKRILDGKRSQNQERHRNLEQRLRELMGRARLFVNGAEVDINSTDPQSRIVRGFQQLIQVTYPNLKMLHGKAYQESEIEGYLRPAANMLPGNDDIALNEAAQEMLAHIQSNQRSGGRTSLKVLVDRYEKKPYGWSLASIQCNLALLVAHGKVQVRKDGAVLEDAKLVPALRNSAGFQSVVLEPQIEFSSGQVRALKEFFEDFFDRPPSSSEARELANETAAAMRALCDELTLMATNSGLYPFLKSLNEPKLTLRGLGEKPYEFFLTDLPGQAPMLLEKKEKVIAPILSLWNGPQRKAFDEARQFHSNNRDNFAHLDGTEWTELDGLLASLDVYQGNGMQRLRTLVETLRVRLQELLEQEKQAAAGRIQQLLDGLKSTEEWSKLSTEQHGQIETGIQRSQEDITRATNIAVIRDRLHQFAERDYPRLQAQVVRWAQPPVPTSAGDETIHREAPVEFVTARSIAIPFGKTWLADEADIEEYLQATREAFRKEIARGKRITLS